MPVSTRRTRRFRLLAAALAASLGTGVALLAGDGPVSSSTPSSGTLDDSTAEVRWSGSTIAQTGGLSGGGCVLTPAPAPGDPTCDTFALTIGDLSSPPSTTTTTAAPTTTTAPGTTKKPKKGTTTTTLPTTTTTTPPPPPPPADDVMVAISTSTPGVVEFDLYVYGPDGTEVARGANLGSNDTVTLFEPAAGTYTVAVQNVLSSDPTATYDAVARRLAATPPVSVDEEATCGLEGAPVPAELRDVDNQFIGASPVVGDPTAALEALEDDGRAISLDVLVLLDGVPQADAEEIFRLAARSYRPLDIQLRAVEYRTVSFQLPDALGLIGQAKDLLGGKRPAGVDVVEVLTSKDIQQLGQTAVAGLADCIGGVAHPDRAFLVAEAYSLQNIQIDPLPVMFDYQAQPNVTAHEIGHLFGGQHHYANCVEGLLSEAGEETSPCTLMFNDVGLASFNFSTVNTLVVRGHSEAYAGP